MQAGIGTFIQDTQPLQAGPGCSQATATAVLCSSSTVTALELNAGDGDDTLEVEAAKPVTVRGGDGFDTVTMTGTGPATLIGDRGNDTLTSGSGGATFNGGDGDDLITGGTGPDTLDYSQRSDAMTVFLTTGTASGDAARGTDALEGSIETVIGGDGDDTLFDEAGTQTLRGGPGNDSMIMSGGGNDRADGNDGDDVFYDGNGDDRYYGDDGDDTVFLYASSGADEVNGGLGADTVSYASVIGGLNLSADGLRNDGVPASTTQLDNVQPDTEIIEGGKGADTLTATVATLQLFGLGGNDTFVSSTGKAALFGGAGQDHVRWSAPARPST